jgi:hypothetical protein
MGKVGKMGGLKVVEKCEKVAKSWDILRKNTRNFKKNQEKCVKVRTLWDYFGGIRLRRDECMTISVLHPDMWDQSTSFFHLLCEVGGTQGFPT